MGETEADLSVFTKTLLSEQTFTCAVCKNLLKPPITLIQNVGNACFPCFKNNQPKHPSWVYVPNQELDKILENLRIPCRYENCDEMLIYSQLETHEKTCVHREFSCLLKTCPWKGPLVEFSAHFSTGHTQDFLQVHENDTKYIELEIPLTQSPGKQFVKMLKINGQVRFLMVDCPCETKVFFLVLYDCNNDKFNPPEDFEANFKFLGDVGKFKIKCPVIPIEDFPGNSVMGKMVSRKLLQELTTKNENMKIPVKISFGKYKFGKIHEEILKHLKCPQCGKLMRSPIFQCENGHSLCHNCHAPTCPICHGKMGDLRNYSMEKLTDEMHFSCTYKNLGCGVVLLGKNMGQHENFCAHKIYECPIETCKNVCGDFSWLRAHFQQIHNEIYTQQNPFENVYNIPGKEEIYYLGLDNNCYKLTIETVGNGYFFHVDILNKHDKSQKYLFEIKIQHVSDAGIYKSQTAFCGAPKGVDFYENDIAPYKHTLTIKYSCKIFKV